MKQVRNKVRINVRQGQIYVLTKHKKNFHYSIRVDSAKPGGKNPKTKPQSKEMRLISKLGTVQCPPQWYK
jgi:hypothetical protein